jgi:hypothetical protein
MGAASSHLHPPDGNPDFRDEAGSAEEELEGMREGTLRNVPPELKCGGFAADTFPRREVSETNRHF